jgi:hypothetical protein
MGKSGWECGPADPNRGVSNLWHSATSVIGDVWHCATLETGDMAFCHVSND